MWVNQIDRKIVLSVTKLATYSYGDWDLKKPLVDGDSIEIMLVPDANDQECTAGRRP